jgi:hypothetical protein
MLSEDVWDIAASLTTLVFIASCILLVSSLLAACVYSVHRKFVKKANKSLKSVWVVVHAFSAFFASIVVTVLLSLSASSSLPFVVKHCHSSNCEKHVPSAIDSNLLNLLFVFFVVSMLMICWILIKAHQKKLTAQISSLLLLSQNKLSNKNQWPNTTIIEAPQPVLLNVGLIYPKLLISSQLIDSLQVDEVKLLLAYEYGKAKRFENIKVKLLQIVCLMWPSNNRFLLILDARNMLRARACNEIHLLLGSQPIHLSDEILSEIPRDVQQFVLKINGDYNNPPNCIANHFDDGYLSVIGYVSIVSYYICLVVVTSNLSHILFELVD